MSKIDDAIQYLKNDTARSRRKGYSHATVGILELEALLEWAEKVRESNPTLLEEEK
jgi:hypothetical protein